MIRRILFTVALLIILNPLTALTFRSERSGAIALQGAYGDILSVEVSTLKAQTQEYMAGMPFNIKDRSVQPASSGRGIAQWSIISNTAFNIKVNAAPLAAVNDPSTKLDYEMIFNYEFGYVSPAGETKMEGSFDISSKNYISDIKEQTPVTFAFENGYDPEFFIGSVDGMIFFRFLEDISNDNSLPAGTYKAQVEILIESGE